MGGKKGGQIAKEAAKDAKKAAEEAQATAARDKEWGKGAKSNAKEEAEAKKKAAIAARKAENAALLAEEEKSQRSTPKNANAKTAAKKAKGPSLDLARLDSPSDTSTTTAPTLNATGIDNALDALSLTTDPSSQTVDRNAGKRVKAAFKAYLEEEGPAFAHENPGLRKQQREDALWKRFQKSEKNPLNQAGVVAFDASKEEIKEARERVREGVEGRLGEK